YYTVTAVTKAGEGPPSDAASFDPSMLVNTPGPVRDLSAKPKEGKVKLSWSPPADDGGSRVTGYVIYRGTSPADPDEVVRVGDINKYEDDPPRKDMTYHYAVKAMNLAGEGDLSVVVDVHVVAANPNATPSTGTILLFIVAVILIAFGATVWALEPVKYSLLLLLLPLFTRFTKDQVMDNKNRHAIHGLIIDNPGIHFNGIMKEYEIPAGVATYHLAVLERENFIRSLRDGRLKRFYSTHVTIPDGKLRKTPEEVRWALIDLVQVRPGISQMELIQELGIKRKTVSYHLAVLVKEGVIEPKKMGRYTVYSANGHS
ncbi:MAG: winged helix-turn-helix transcriptional regulator, partial [Thermoplasmata archaeon]|nr:winged helix-turn-helix transcriptional regulator [Thermoplasmata archaeon]